MGSLILCHKKKATTPFEVVRVHKYVYTIEELCFYLCNHLYLVDHTIMNTKICDWIQNELELPQLAEKLRTILEENGSMEQFVMMILSSTYIYTQAELNHIKVVLEKLKNQKPIEKQKYKADNLLQSGSVKAAIVSYQAILHGERDESVDSKFYGKVYACLGAAYGRLFLYEEAAKTYEAAYQICEEEPLLRAYVYACKQYMTETEYETFLAKSNVYQEMSHIVEEQIAAVQEKVATISYDDTLEKWKEGYRRISTGEN